MSNWIVDVPISVDEESMRPRGWNVLDARARLSYDHWHSLALSIELQFVKANWAGRYRFHDYLCPVLCEISSPKLGETRYVNLGHFEPKKLRGGKVKTSISDSFAYDHPNLSAADLTIRLLSCDIADVPLSLHPLERVARRLTLSVVDETSAPNALSVNVSGGAFVTAGEDGGGVVVSLSGELTPPPYGTAATIAAEREDREPDGTFDYIFPDVEVDVLDATDFLLTRGAQYPGVELTGKKAADLPSRAAHWITYTEFAAHDLPGEPSKVVVRLIDPDY